VPDLASKTAPTRVAVTAKAPVARVQSTTQALARVASRENRATRRALHVTSKLPAGVRLAQAYQREATASQALYAKRQSLQQANSQRQSRALRNRAGRSMYLAQSAYSRQQYVIRGLLGIRMSRAVRLATSRYPLASPWAITFTRQLALSGLRARPAAGTGRPRGRPPGSKSLIAQAATTRSAARSGRRYKPRAAPAGAPATAPAWITAGNDAGTPNCTSVAIANHLLAAVGIRASDAAIARLDALHDGTIAGALDALRRRQPWRHYAVLARARPAPAPAPGQVWGLSAPQGPHAALSTGAAMIASWGQDAPFTGQVEEAWCLAWMTATRHARRR
jgi:hypothetical protein